MSQVKILFFATLRDIAGHREIEMEIPDEITMRELKGLIVDSIPALKDSGVAEIFGPGTRTDDIVEYIKANIKS